MEKLYYSIGEVAQVFKVNTSLIRYWESEFDILNPKKNKKGNRLFTSEDIKSIQMIYHLLKEKGYTLEGAKKKIGEDRDDLKVKSELIHKLRGVRSELLELNDLF